MMHRRSAYRRYWGLASLSPITSTLGGCRFSIAISISPPTMCRTCSSPSQNNKSADTTATRRQFKKKQVSFQRPPPATTKVLCSTTLCGRRQPQTLRLKYNTSSYNTRIMSYRACTMYVLYGAYLRIPVPASWTKRLMSVLLRSIIVKQKCTYCAVELVWVNGHHLSDNVSGKRKYPRIVWWI